MSPRAKKVLSFILIAFVGLMVGIAISFYVLLKLSVPPTDGSASLPGLQGEVRITFDRMGIPQIWADTETDAFFALGYQHAADRMFQMDISRRVASGRLSELLGGVTTEIDIQQRRIGHLRMARVALDRLSDDNRRLLRAYADGVNAYAENCRALPFEYRFLPTKFEPWTITDCLTLLSFQTWFSNALMNQDEFYLRLSEKIGQAKARTLVLPYPDWAPAVVDQYESAQNPDRTPLDDAPPVLGQSDFSDRPADRLRSLGFGALAMSHSSNAWVVAPHKSGSGRAMLASDPHLELTRLPQFWYAAAIHVGQDSSGVLGITTPGLPFFVMGHNGRSAWAFTAGGCDVSDYYLEKINPVDSNQYLAADGWHDLEIIEDTIRLAGDDSLRHVTFKITEHGPIIFEDAEKSQARSYYWIGFDVDLNAAVSGGFALHRAATFDDFRMAVTSMGALDANMLYADADGNIGYQLTTPLRVRQPGTWVITSAAKSEASPSVEYQPPANTPHALNPECGWLASCNNLPSRSGTVQGYFFANRILSVVELLQSKDTLSAADLEQFQMDRTDRYLMRFAGEVARLLDIVDEPQLAQLMRDWDGSAGADSREAAIINVYLTELKLATFEDELGDLAFEVPSKWIEQIERIDSAGWFDDVTTEDETETYEEVAIGAIEETLGAINGQTWGDMHYLKMDHPLSVIPIIGSLLGLTQGPLPWGGTAGTLNASFFRQTADGSFESVAGPSWRFVIDFADIDAATMVLPTGNSGNPMTDHFMDFFDMWASGERWTVPFSSDRVIESAISTLKLLPKDSL